MGFLDYLKKLVNTGMTGSTGNNSSSKNNAEQKPAFNKKSMTFTFSKIPATLAEMKALPEASLDSPFKTAALTVCALAAYGKDPAAGIEMLNFLKGPQPLVERDLQFLKDRFRDGQSYVPMSFFEGSSPSNNYTPNQPFKVTVFDNPYSYDSEGYATLWIKSSGADSERQVKLRKKGSGEWFLWDQMLLGSIRIPSSQDPWA